MNALLVRATRTILVAATLGCAISAFAGQEMLDLDAKFRAKIAKEKIKSAALQRKMDEQGKSSDASSCGSQNIGNLDTGGRNGPAPREVFVFAPNAINVVGRGSCQ